MNIRKTQCERCKELRPLSIHLYELATICHLLDNSSTYKDAETEQKVFTRVIGDWLGLASELEKVEINKWKFSDDSALYCGTAADRIDSDSKHFGIYSTALTKFIFVSNALEETYRFVANRYDSWALGNVSKKYRHKKASMKAAAIIDFLVKKELPNHLDHLVDNYLTFYCHYHDVFKPKLSAVGMERTSSLSYGLHLVRNLRNHIAHGEFPIIDNPEYWPAEEGHRTRDCLYNLLLHSCRLSALYIQVLLYNYNNGFESYEYANFKDSDDTDMGFLIKHCTLEYILALHLHGGFGFNSHDFEKTLETNAEPQAEYRTRDLAAEGK